MPTGPGLSTAGRLDRGALVVYPTQDGSSEPQTILFQYNPEQVTRNLASRTPQSSGDSGGDAKEDVLRVAGPPVETISLGIVLDAADQLEQPSENQTIVEHGLGPVLSVLEMLLYPPTLRVQENEELAAGGEVQVTEADLPLVLLVWGRSRVAPVKITSFAITEEAFDTRLNPIRAKVDLGLTVLTYMELEAGTEGYKAFLSYQRTKEQLAAQHPTGGNPLEDRLNF